MARPKTKTELLEAADDNFDKMWQLIDSMTEEEFTTEFDFKDNPKDIAAHWKRDKNVRDILVHLYEWHQLLIRWVEANQSGVSKSFLPATYNWRNYAKMNVEFWEKHQNTSYEEAKELLLQSHEEVMALLRQFTNEELFTKKYFDWTGTTSLGSSFVSSTSSHYEWATKKIRKHIKQLKKQK